jgi:hypothetical protein
MIFSVAFPEGSSSRQRKENAMVGFALSLSHVRWGERGAPVACL